MARVSRGALCCNTCWNPRFEINPKYQAVQILDESGLEYSGVVTSEDEQTVTLIPNLLTPTKTVTVPKSTIEHRGKSKLSSMPAGLLNVLTKREIVDLVSYLEHGGYKLPTHLQKKHAH